MALDTRFVTLVSGERDSHWSSGGNSKPRTVVVPNWEAFRQALLTALRKPERIVERVIIDRTVDCPTLLYFLRGLPATFDGDVLFIGRDERSLLSHVRAGERLLIMLTPSEVRTFLQSRGFYGDAVMPAAA